MKRLTAIGSAVIMVFIACSHHADGEPVATAGTDSTGTGTAGAAYPGYRLVWQDEFNGTALDTANWNYETGGDGWGNNELEYYKAGSGNAYLQSGNLVIEAKKETMGNRNYTSARITTENKKTFTYGRYDMRAKLPVQTGMWPALWMLGTDIRTAGWPHCGELDIMELIGKTPSTVYGTLHWEADNKSPAKLGKQYNLGSGNFSDSFHLFSLIWEPGSYRILVDNTEFYTGTSADITASYNPFAHPFFFIFNVAVGGDWPGPPDASTVFPQKMLVDYVRVYQK